MKVLGFKDSIPEPLDESKAVIWCCTNFKTKEDAKKAIDSLQSMHGYYGEVNRQYKFIIV